MKTPAKIGIWMDHASAHTIEPAGSSDKEIRIVSRFTPIEQSETIHKGEEVLHNKERGQQKSYYEAIAKVILGYDHVLLFGPTNAKNELMNLLKEDHHFANIRIKLETTDRMSEAEQQAMVNQYFAKQS
jgi:stalled ribosome rescue protein Dom34